MIISSLSAPVLALPRWVKRTVALCVDGGLCLLTLWLALYLRVGEWMALSGDVRPAAFASLLIALPVFVVFGLYRAVFRYADWSALVTVAFAVTVYGICYSSIFTAYGVPGVPRTVGIIQPVLLLIAIGMTRALARYWLGGEYKDHLRRSARSNVLIYGAGAAGRQLASAIGGSRELKVVAFVDDDRGLQGSVLSGLKVLSPKDLPGIVESYSVTEIYLAMPSATRKRRNEIIEVLRSIAVRVRTLPGLMDLAHGRVHTTDLTPLDIEDLLGRDPVAPDVALFEKCIRNKVVLVTGAGGSIGSELCRQILAIGPAKLLLVESSEYALYAIHHDLERRLQSLPSATELVPLIASVQDNERVLMIMNTWRPKTVYHAAAYKHVPLVEHNLIDGVRNNVLGTLTTALAAQSSGADDFVLISTDKAVRPTNVMGASKRLAELILQSMAALRPNIRFSMVRFGNVLGSSGSVVPLFRQQIDRGGPITVTDPEITRYFMTIKEAAQLVIQAGAMASGGEVFVLDMGEPVKILDLATRMIELSGLKPRNQSNPEGDLEIIFTGLRPGEKLFEELLIGDDPVPTPHPRILKANEGCIPIGKLMPEIDRLKYFLSSHEVEEVARILKSLVTEYSPTTGLADWTYLAERPKEEHRPSPVLSGSHPNLRAI